MRIKIEELLNGVRVFEYEVEWPKDRVLMIDLPGNPFAGSRRQIRLTEVKEEKVKGG